LQTAAEDARISAVVAAEAFSDLATVARERAPWFFTRGSIRRALDLAERTGNFKIDEVSPAAAAGRISIPVLLIHGARDGETPPIHSQRIFDALRGPRRLSIVDGAGHNQSLHASWPEIERWIDEVIAPLASAVR
jgi:pimeloyl-ACP methyl ester carboxylesterase